MGEKQEHCVGRSRGRGLDGAVAVGKEFLCSSQATQFLGVTRSQVRDGAGPGVKGRKGADPVE